MTQRLTKFADASLELADMKVKLSKTFTQHVRCQEKVAPATAAEITAKEATYKFPCEFSGAGCRARFKTKQGMMVHSTTCNFGYGTTEEFLKWKK